MKISEVFGNSCHDLEIENIMDNSRKVLPNSIFFAVIGAYRDGHDYIEMAIENGAICVVHQKELENYHDDILYIKVDDSMWYYNMFTSAFYGNPSQKMKVFGVTGTNGKTTTAWIMQDIIQHFEKCSYSGTIGYLCDGEVINTGLTTPQTIKMHQIFKEVYDKGYKVMAMEASSEGIATHRVDGVDFDCCIFTNLASDHMNFHGDRESYFLAKASLFTRLGEDKVAVINGDDEYGRRLFDMTNSKKVTYGLREDSTYRIVDVNEYPNHTDFSIVYGGVVYKVETNLVAMFNVYNLVSVLAAANEMGYPLTETTKYTNNVSLAPGRCQLVKAGQDFNVIVDFAFTKFAFENIYKYAKAITKEGSKIISVFGAAGNRDHGRRPGTATIADEYSDVIILTEDDTENEVTDEIVADLAQYIKKHEYTYIEDRYSAIEKAVSLANAGDTICILGKGDEKFLIMKNSYRQPWMGDECAAVTAIEKLKKN